MKFTHQPVKFPKLRTHGLASVRGAMFGMTRNGGTRAHQGIDLAVDNGYKCYAVENGKIITISTEWGGHGYVAMLEMNCPEKHALHGKIAFYSHLSSFQVEVGAIVKAGAVIGLSGSSGNAKGMETIQEGAHLHFEIRNNRIAGLGLRNRIDPLPYIELIK